jgi:KipI family sensor histidine kinase inhibitor
VTGLKGSRLGDRALVLSLARPPRELGEAGERIRLLASALKRKPLPGQQGVIPAYDRLTVLFSRPLLDAEVARNLRRVRTLALPKAPARSRPIIVEIPVRYGGRDGPDLEEVARLHRMAPERVIALHCEPLYDVQLIGFVPGFPYLGGLAPELATPRLETPRASIPAGSVGIGGSQTGIYPQAGPAGWRIIGRSDTRLFDPARRDPCLLKAGMKVRFVRGN